MLRPVYIMMVLMGGLLSGAFAIGETGSYPVHPLRAGELFPHVELTNTEYETVHLHDQFKEHPLLLIYYRGGW